ncbi:hypothetical protein [Shinella sp.]|uniref:hypothetical protein n=1 Tax=Shinella sp. TaxID=1870904 RepID=UPI00301C7BF5
MFAILFSFPVVLLGAQSIVPVSALGKTPKTGNAQHLHNLGMVRRSGEIASLRKRFATKDEKNICLYPNKSQFSAHRLAPISAIGPSSNT